MTSEPFLKFCRRGLLRAACAASALGTLFAAASLPVAAQPAAPLPEQVAQALQAAGIAQQDVAVVVQEASFGAAPPPRLSVNATQPFNPASLMKLLTTYAALETLGPAYTWKTEAWTLGTLSNGVLQGDLVLKGGGDPKLSLARFWLLLRQLRARGVREIRGDLVLDRSLFDTAQSDGAAASFDDQPLRPYNVSPDALLVNFKALRLQLVPDPAGKSLALLADPRPANLDIVDLIKPSFAGHACAAWKEGLRADLSYRRGRARLMLTGSYPLACGENSWNLAVLSHPHYVEGVFRQLWQELGGRLRGGLREAALPAAARLLASVESPTLGEVVRDINKYSNNVMARQLLLTLGAASVSPPVPSRPEDGAQAIRAWLADKQLNFPELVLENGAGLSRRERIAAGSLAQLLLAAWQSPVMPELLASLPLSAVDGTMRKRLSQPGVAGHAHIKTGSLEGVKAIAGYVLDRAGQWQIVVFLVNHPNAQAAQAAQDALLLWVYQRGA